MGLKEEPDKEISISLSKDNRTLPEEKQEKAMHCTSNFEDRSFDVEGSGDDKDGNSLSEKEDPEIDILECTGPSDCRVEELHEKCEDGTDDYPSSFGGTASESENGSASSDLEVDSPVYADAPLPSVFDGFGGVPRFRKKRLTDHWRRFIRPINWRCKWLELQINEIESQARKCDKELEETYQKKQVVLDKLNSEELGIKSQALPCQTQRSKVMKRKKRKRVEATTDISSYMSDHNFFSYYEYRKSLADRDLLLDNSRNVDYKTKNSKNGIAFNEESPSIEFNEGDIRLGQILLKIEAAKSETLKLKTRVDKVLSEFPGKFSSVNRLTLLGTGDSLTSSVQKPSSFTETKEEKQTKSVSAASDQMVLPDGETGDILMSESVVSSQEEEKPVPVETTQNVEQDSVAGSSGNVKKRSVRKRKRAVKEEITERPRVSKEKPKTNLSTTSRLKIPKRKRNRGKQKSGSVGLRRKS